MRLPVLLLIASACAAGPRALFNGKDLTGWSPEGPHPSFFCAAGELRTSGRGQAGNWLHTVGEFGDFRLKFEYKLSQWAEAALIVRAPRSERPQHAGLTLMLAHDYHNETTPYITGGIAGALSPRERMPASFEQWHRAELLLDGQHLVFRVDGVLLQDVELERHEALRDRLRSGVIGFADMGYAYAVRALEIEELRPPAAARDLLETPLERWSKRGDSGEWQLRDGLLTGQNGHSILYAPGEYGDFDLTAVVRTHERVNAGVFLRGQPEGPARGFEVQIYSPVDAVYPTGSVYGRNRSVLESDLEGRWFLLQIRVEGGRCVVRVDGRETARVDTLPEELLRPGRIGLQIHSDDGRVEFRDVRVRAR